MKAVKKKKKSIFLRIALLAFSLYVIITLVQLQMDIGNKQKQLDAVQENILLQQQLNGDLKSKLENPDEYIEQEARDQNMVKPGEIVMQEVPGK
ncbi:MAG: FtsB family cell division protein [Acutalibacteraceae bacterium]